LPRNLKNALEHLLTNLVASGADLDDLFTSSAALPAVSHQPAQPVTVLQTASTFGNRQLPPLPGHAQHRLDLLRKHSDALESFGMRKRRSDQHKVLMVALRKLREKSPDLRPTEIAELQMLYEALRQDRKDEPK